MNENRRYTVNLNEGRPHTVHREHPWEVCNVDDADEKVIVDKTEADELLNSNAAELCLHCLKGGLDYAD